MFLKAVGALLIFAVCTLGGFCLSSRLTARRRALHEIAVATEEIAQGIVLGEERGRIIKKVFADKTLKVCEDESFNISFSSACLNKEDACVLNEFFSRLGSGDTAGQVALCEGYKRIFEKLCEGATQEEQNKGRLYKTCGPLAAAALIIFII